MSYCVYIFKNGERVPLRVVWIGKGVRVLRFRRERMSWARARRVFQGCRALMAEEPWSDQGSSERC
jgi:hypothetical protein